MDCYFGSYHVFETVSKKEGAPLAGPDNLVGDEYEVTFTNEQGKRRAWLTNRFGAKVGFFDAEFSRTLSLMAAREWTVRAFLSFVAYTDQPAPGRYWGEMAVICYNPLQSEPFERFASTIATRLGEGVRPELNLGDQGITRVLESGGSWTPTQYAPLPEKALGTAILKSSRSAKEKLIEQGRKGNKGCYLVSWAFIAVAVVGMILAFKGCAGL